MALSAAFTLAVYLKDEWRYQYPGFSLFYIWHNRCQGINISGIIVGTMLGTGAFLIYITLRETVIAFIEKPGTQRLYRIMIVNQLATFIGIYLVFIVLAQLVLDELYHNFIGLFSIPLFSIILGFVNIYYIFPKDEGRKLFSGWLLVRLMLLSLAVTIPVIIFMHGEFALAVSLVFQLLIVTPVSWLLYQQQKDHILAFKGMEKDLSRSTADLQALRSQINPHFLFNTFNTIYYWR